MKISIAHLYPDLLNIYGDKGNVLAFINRCQWRGIEVELDEIQVGQKIDSEKYDFYFIGGGQDQQQIEVSKELQHRKASLIEARDKGAVFLAICGGYQLLGHYYKPHNGDELKGISLIDAYTVAGNKRYIGNVTIESDFLNPNSVVGFENHSGLTYLNGDTLPIGKVSVGYGNNGEDKGEGARFKNVFGTYLHGSLLPKNPHFTDYLIELALERNFGNINLIELNDEIEWTAHKKAVNRKY